MSDDRVTSDPAAADGSKRDGESDQCPVEAAIDALFAESDRPAADSGADSSIDDHERTALAAAGVDPDAVSDTAVSYRALIDNDVDRDLANALRRRFSLPWSFGTDGELDRRSSEVRGLGDAEREWIAVSEDDWQAFEYDNTSSKHTESDDRPWPKPTPVTAVAGVSADDAAVLAEAGIVSAERLATIDATTVASLLDLDVVHVRTWRYNARELIN